MSNSETKNQPVQEIRMGLIKAVVSPRLGLHVAVLPNVGVEGLK